MKLLVITELYPPHQLGGYEMRCKEVMDELVIRGHAVLILTSRCPREKCELHENEPAVNRKLHLRHRPRAALNQVIYDFNDLRLIDQRVKQFKPDLIYLWGIRLLSKAILPYFSYQKVPIVYDEGDAGLVELANIQKSGLYFHENSRDSRYQQASKKISAGLINWFSQGLIKPHWAWPQHMQVYFNCNTSLKYAQDAGFRWRTPGSSIRESRFQLFLIFCASRSRSR